MKIRESLITRRKFFYGLILGGFAALASYGLIPVIKYLFFMIEAPLPKAVSMKKEVLSNFPENSARYFYYGWLPSIMVHTSDGDFRAFSAVCTHLDCIVSFRPDKRDIFCNCHDGIFDINGKNREGPPPKPLERFDIFYEGEKVIITRHKEPEKKPKMG